MKRLLLLLWLAPALGVGGCSSHDGLTPAQLRARWEEQNVYPANYKADVTAFMQTYLNDPTQIRGAAVTRPQLKHIAGDPAERYMVCLRYTARNSDGGYAAPKETIATFVSGKFERFIDPQRGDVGREAAARVIQELCKDAVYEPFPELQRLRR